MIVTVFHQGDAPRVTAALDAAGIPWVDYNVGRGVTEANWAAGVHLLEIGAVNEAGGPRTPAITIFNSWVRETIFNDNPEHVLATIRNNFQEEAA